jgi:hypothetical protein
VIKNQNSGFIWRILLALLITLAAAYYQRITGPSYPMDGEIKIDGKLVSYQLLRTYGGDGDQPVDIELPDSTAQPIVMFRRFNTGESWKAMKMYRDGFHYSAALPHQPPAGKIEYFILLEHADKLLLIPPDDTVVTRFRGDVPEYILIPHIFIMFFAMLISTTTGLEALARGGRAFRLTIWTTIMLFIGGIILGPLVQKFAFDSYWTGFPFGYDLTDNKTLIAFVFWVIALWRAGKNGKGRVWIITAAIVLLLVFSIPHSLMGSEYNYQKMQVETGNSH